MAGDGAAILPDAFEERRCKTVEDAPVERTNVSYALLGTPGQKDSLQRVAVRAIQGSGREATGLAVHEVVVD